MYVDHLQPSPNYPHLSTLLTSLFLSCLFFCFCSLLTRQLQFAFALPWREACPGVRLTYPRVPLFQQRSNANSISARGETWCWAPPPPTPILGYCLSWVCTSLGHTVTTAVNSRAHLSYCVWKTLLLHSHPPHLPLAFTLGPPTSFRIILETLVEGCYIDFQFRSEECLVPF